MHLFANNLIPKVRILVDDEESSLPKSMLYENNSSLTSRYKQKCAKLQKILGT